MSHYPASRLHGPTIMPHYQWTRAPSEGERRMIGLWEEKYSVARDLLHTPMRIARPAHLQNGTIAPHHYLDWLRQAYHGLMRTNVANHPQLAGAYEQELQIADESGYFLREGTPPRLGEQALSVGRYGNRVRGEQRGHDLTGVRLDLHHSPHDNSSYLSRPDGTVVAIPEDVHRRLHFQRDRESVGEPLVQQVEKDFAFILREMMPRGYARHDVLRALKQTHTRNKELGVYDRAPTAPALG